MKNKIVIIGTGNVGVSYAYSLLCSNLNVHEIVLIDINTQKAEGEALDLLNCTPLVAGSTNIKFGTYEDCNDASIICITAGVTQRADIKSRMEDLYKATNIFIKKIRQNKTIEAKDLLNNFDLKVPLLSDLSLHQFTILNEDIFMFLESHLESLSNKKEIASNLGKYIEYLKNYSKNEVLASFAHYLNDKKYEETAHFIASESFSVYREVVKYTIGIKV